MSDEADTIALAVLEEFTKLPAKRKPAVRDNGLHEWVPLSGIVVKGSNSLKCIALATGMKCLPATKLPEANGIAIHDWHAEILAIRAFNVFLLHECRRLARGEESEYLLPRPSSTPEQFQPFIWNPEFTLHMYCSEAPCGDASMELIMSAQPDASPWDVPPSLSPTHPPTDPQPPRTNSNPSPPATLPGRAFFSHLGIVRRKPSRGDAPLSRSKSCSDKLALKQCTSLLSSLNSLFLPPVYLTSLVLPHSQFSDLACRRCFSPSGRMASLAGRTWAGGYGFVPFAVRTTGEEFGHSKRAVAGRAERVGGSNLAVAWTAGEGGKKVEVKGASRVSRRRMWELAREEGVRGVLDGGTYKEVKEAGALALRRQVKKEVWRDGLRGWVRNQGDDGFGI
ncbi:adenosine-deaminase domain-containing protein [Schizothecium vesticola]|uniref:Adenosine-deaminase domain-containing protein n=1 Tax=Schizothecium vesticola TaxID=314040 RepID=A0AA40F175_9PEZI|nr:adenosine-deaminase domain-containing protein [Schizothecium vesticola]